ncbi:MAG: histidinol-phosphate transaminase [Pseudomonadota bacterium]|nr:histidinol-phosphate transaminase [Pseudomonadota bacterium]
MPSHIGPAALAAEHVQRIAPYQAGKPISELARELSLPLEGIVKLASNENPRGASAAVRAAMLRAMDEVCRYPDSNAHELKQALAARFAITPEEIVLGNGSNDVLELVTQAFLLPGQRAVYAQHAFVVYSLATQARGGIGIEVPATRSLGHDLPAMLAAITADTRIVFIANPNNPTGTWLAPDELGAFLDRVPEHVIVVLDEAYNEYLAPEQQAPTIEWIARHPNLIVSRTFSKAYGLAALRVGYGLMHASLADMLNRVRQPFNVNAVAQAAALAALDETAYVDESREINRRGMRQLEDGLDALGVKYLASHGNFLLVEVGDGARVYQRLLERGVIVRPVANYGLAHHLRVTVGLPHENARFLEALRQVVRA